MARVGRKDCKYNKACGCAENCARCKGYEKEKKKKKKVVIVL